MPSSMNRYHRIPLSLLCLVLTSVTLPSVAEDWPQYNGPGHDRRSAEQLSDGWLSASPSTCWVTPMNAGFSSLAVAGGAVFTLVVGEVNGVSRETCVAYDRDSGEEMWAVPLAAEARYDRGGDSGIGENRGGDGPRSTPVYDDGNVYVLDAQLHLYCIGADGGELIWSRHIIAEYDGRLIGWQNAASPMVDGDLVYVMGGGEGQALLAFNKNSGTLAWKGEDDGISHATPIAATIHGVRQIVFLTQTGLVALEAESGALLWRQEFPYSSSAAASPVVYQDIVYCSAGYGVGAGAYRIVHADDGFSVREIWRKRNKLVNHWSTPVCKDGYLYGMFSFKAYGDGPLKCVDLNTGEVCWSANGFGPGNCIVVGEHVVALSDQGEVILIDTDPEAYRELSRVDVLDGKCWSTPSFSDGDIYVRSTVEGARVSSGR